MNYEGTAVTEKGLLEFISSKFRFIFSDINRVNVGNLVTDTIVRRRIAVESSLVKRDIYVTDLIISRKPIYNLCSVLYMKEDEEDHLHHLDKIETLGDFIGLFTHADRENITVHFTSDYLVGNRQFSLPLKGIYRKDYDKRIKRVEILKTKIKIFI